MDCFYDNLTYVVPVLGVTTLSLLFNFYFCCRRSDTIDDVDRESVSDVEGIEMISTPTITIETGINTSPILNKSPVHYVKPEVRPRIKVHRHPKSKRPLLHKTSIPQWAEQEFLQKRHSQTMEELPM